MTIKAIGAETIIPTTKDFRNARGNILLKPTLINVMKNAIGIVITMAIKIAKTTFSYFLSINNHHYRYL